MVIRFGVIGCGSIGQVHIVNLKKIKQAELVAAADIREEALKEVKSKYNIPYTYTDYRDLLAREDVDAVIIATPNRFHAPMTIEAIKAGKHVLCEKPPAITTREVIEMFNASKKYNRKLQIGLMFRFLDKTVAFKKLIEAGALGEVYYARTGIIRRSGIPGMGSWFTRKRDAGAGPLYDIGVHALDLTLWLIGDFKAKSVYASTYAKFGPRGKGMGKWGIPVPGGVFDVEDLAVAFIKMESGATIYLEVSWAAHAHDTELFSYIFGDKGGIDYVNAILYTEENDRLIDKKIHYEKNNPYIAEVEHFIKVIEEDKEPLTKPEEMIYLQAILEAALKSAEENKVIEVKKMLEA